MNSQASQESSCSIMFKHYSLVKYTCIITILFSKPDIIPYFILHQFIHWQLCKKIDHTVSKNQEPGAIVGVKFAIHKRDIKFRRQIPHYIFNLIAYILKH